MERGVELAVHQAVDLSRARGGRLVAIMFRGGDASSPVLEAARRVLRRFGLHDVEVTSEPCGGPVRLGAIELSHPR